MKILQIGKYYPPVYGGIETVTYNLSESLIKQGIRCDVLCVNMNNEYAEEIINGYRVYRVKSNAHIASTDISFQLITKLKELQNYYDLIHIHMPNPMANLAVFLTKPKAKIILHWHSDILKQRYLLKFYKPLQKWLIKRADLIIGPTKSHIYDSDYAELLRIKAEIIPHGIDVANFNESMVDEGWLKMVRNEYEGRKIIFSVGRLVYYKGFNYLIDSAKYLDDDYIILIIGDGPLRNELLNKIIKSKLESKVKLLGVMEQNKLLAYYKGCHIFTLPSIYRTEMFGMVQLEAMMFGKPIVSTNIERSGVSHVNVHGKTGLTVEVKNSEELAKAFVTLTEKKELYEEMSNRCRKTFNETYAMNKISEQIIKVYKKLLLSNQ